MRDPLPNRTGAPPSRVLLAVGLAALAACADAPDDTPRTDGMTDEGTAPNLVVFEFTTKSGGASGRAQQSEPSQGSSGRRQSAQDQSRRSQARQRLQDRRTALTGPVSVAGVLTGADAPQLARLVLRDPPDAPASAEGTLLFGDLAALAEWRQTDMDDFLAPMGGADAVATTIRVVNKDTLAAYGLGGTQTGLENLSITYTNTGNDTGGADADIDAVTVVCPGDFAECSPSN